jgi:hypothetical protein
VPNTKADLEGVRPAANAFTASTLNSIGFTKLKQVFSNGKTRAESIMRLRICQRVSFDQLLASHFLRPNYQGSVSRNMKKIFILPTFISFAMICSCQKQDSAAEQELAQRKTELDARENALDERMNALDERVKALDERVKILAENQKAMANAGINSTGVQGETPDPAQEQAERERIQQFSADMRARIADPSRLNSARAEKERRTQERLAQRQRALDGSQSQKQRNSKMFSGAVFPAPEASSPIPSSAVEAASPTPSPAVEAISPTPSPTPE